MIKLRWAQSVIPILAAAVLQTPTMAQQSIETPPIEYSKTEADNLVSRMIKRLDSGEQELEYERGFGYLRSLLEELNVPVSSQVLVFSKTSLQVRLISRRNPRAIYFNDDVYVGWVRGSSMMEISTSDPKLGAAFYTVDMTPRRVEIHRANYDCLACHVSTLTQGIPGHTVRSVMPHIDGTIDVQKHSFVTDHRSPFSQRWGGWYVTGRHGEMTHMGNAFLRSGRLATEKNGNRISLRDEFDTMDWLLPYSDIVSLMVLEHQTQMHNAFTKANFAVRRTIHDHNMAYGLANPETAKTVPNEAATELQLTISQAAKEIVHYMLFCDEASLTSEVKGSILFSEEFANRGPNDKQGRSLREFDLNSRLFKYPCSYLIYSPAFDSMEDPLRQQVYLQLWDALTGDSSSGEYQHLDQPTRESIIDILRDTKASLPNYWLKQGGS